jgi:hypothetical protein
MQKDKLYVVTMYRFANRENHSYVLGAFTKKPAAKQAAEAERLYRGGNKYFPEILEFEPNDMSSKHVILALEDD